MLTFYHQQFIQNIYSDLIFIVYVKPYYNRIEHK